MDELTVKEAGDMLMSVGEEPEVAGQGFAESATAVDEARDAAIEAATAAVAEAHLGAGADEEPGACSYADGSVGLGVDIVEIARMQAILERSPHFAERVFSETERAYCDGTANPATHYALRFAAKEAVVKALGTGFAEGIGVRDIEVERAKSGRPSAKLSGRALEVANEQGVRDLSLSLSFTHTDAVACALAVTEASVRATEKRKDPMEELAKQFKETRKILDEL